MTSDHDDPLAALKVDVAPPPALRARVMSDLSAAGILARRRVVRPLLVAAGLAVAFAGGTMFGSRDAAEPEAHGRRFALLLYEGSAFDRAGTHRDEYRAWAEGLGDRLVLGDELGEAVRTLGTSGTLMGDGPTGIFIVYARNLTDAAALAQSCPHLRYGGQIVVRPVVGQGAL